MLGIQGEFDPARVRDSLAFAARFAADPRAVINAAMQEMGMNGGQQPEEQLPEPDLVSEDGRKAYSAERMAQFVDFSTKKLRADIMREMSPIVQAHQQEGVRRQTSEAIAKGNKVLAASLSHARTLPYFKENEQAISERMSTMNPRMLNDVGLVAGIYISYVTHLAESVIPQLQQTIEQKVRDDFAKKAAAGNGSVHPIDSAPSSTGAKPNNVSELAKHLERLSNRATA